MPAATHGWLTAGTESLLNYRGCFCRHRRCCRHKSQALTRASTLQQAKEAWSLDQSINHSFTTSSANSSHCQTKWFLVPLDAVCVHNLFTHGCGSEIYFFTLHTIVALPTAVFSCNLSSLHKTWILCHTFSVACWWFPTRCRHRIRNPVVLEGPTRFPWGGLHCVIE